MRLFVALDIDNAIRLRIGRFLDGVREFAPDVRWVKPESLHITLKFIGEQSEAEAEKIKRKLETIAATAIMLDVRGYGFFPGAQRPRVFWIGIDAAAELTSLATTVDQKLADLGIAREEHSFFPHLTLARDAGGTRRRQENDGGKLSFQRLQQALATQATPEFGTMTAREFFLYQSELSPSGSRYKKLAGFHLQ